MRYLRMCTVEMKVVGLEVGSVKRCGSLYIVLYKYPFTCRTST